MWVRQGVEERCFDHAKDRGRRSDAQSDRQDADCREARRFAQHPKSKAQILKQVVEEGSADCFATFFLETGLAAELNPRPTFCFGASEAETFQMISSKRDVSAKLFV